MQKQLFLNQNLIVKLQAKCDKLRKVKSQLLKQVNEQKSPKDEMSQLVFTLKGKICDIVENNHFLA